jgi:hypothetical protein
MFATVILPVERFGRRDTYILLGYTFLMGVFCSGELTHCLELWEGLLFNLFWTLAGQQRTAGGRC